MNHGSTDLCWETDASLIKDSYSEMKQKIEADLAALRASRIEYGKSYLFAVRESHREKANTVYRLLEKALQRIAIEEAKLEALPLALKESLAAFDEKQKLLEKQRPQREAEEAGAFNREISHLVTLHSTSPYLDRPVFEKLKNALADKRLDLIWRIRAEKMVEKFKDDVREPERPKYSRIGNR